MKKAFVFMVLALFLVFINIGCITTTTGSARWQVGVFASAEQLSEEPASAGVESPFLEGIIEKIADIFTPEQPDPEVE